MNVDDAIQKIVAATENVAPKTWNMLVEYQRLDALTSLVDRTLVVATAVGFAVTMRGAYSALISGLKNDGQSEAMRRIDRQLYTTLTWLFVGMCVAIACVTIIGMVDSFVQLAHPEIYAAQKLVGEAVGK